MVFYISRKMKYRNAQRRYQLGNLAGCAVNVAGRPADFSMEVGGKKNNRTDAKP